MKMKILIWSIILLRGVLCLIYLSPQMEDYTDAERYCASIGGDVMSGYTDSIAARFVCRLTHIDVWYKRAKKDGYIGEKPEGMCYVYGSYWRPCKDKLYFFCYDGGSTDMVNCSGHPHKTDIVQESSFTQNDDDREQTSPYSYNETDEDQTSSYNETEREQPSWIIYYENTTGTVSVSDDLFEDGKNYSDKIDDTFSSLKRANGIDFNIYEIIILVGAVFLITVVAILVIGVIKVFRNSRDKTTPMSSLPDPGYDYGKSDEKLYETTTGRVNVQSHVYATPVISIYDSAV